MKLIRRLRSDEDGMSLVEMLVAMVVFVMMIMALSSLLLHGLFTIHVSGSRSGAVFMTQQELEGEISGSNEAATTQSQPKIDFNGEDVEVKKIKKENEYYSRDEQKVEFETYVYEE